MAEVAAAASVLGIASFAIEVSKGLLAAGKVLVQARGQIARLTKHVSQFGAVIRQVGLVLKRDGPGLCSSELLREIRRLVRSCHATLQEIHHAATSSLEKPLAAVRWLFVKRKAKELEAQLESQKVMLQIMMHTVTVSRLGQLRNSSIEEAEQAARLQAENAEQTSRIQAEYAEKTAHIQAENAEQTAHLRAEIELLKTLIVNGRLEIGRLRRTETSNPQQSNDSQGQKSSSGSSDESSGSSDEAADTSSSSDESSSDSDRDEKAQGKALALRHRPVPELTGLSTMLTRMIPFDTAREQDSEQKRDRGLLTASEHDGQPDNEEGADQLDEALRSTCLLLDKWTIPGSESAMTALGEKSAVMSTNQSFVKGSARPNPHHGLSREHPTNEIFNSDQDILFERVSISYIKRLSTQKDACKYFIVTPEAMYFYENWDCFSGILHGNATVLLHSITPTTRVPKFWMDSESLVKHGLTNFTEGHSTWILEGDINFELIARCIHDTYKRYIEPPHAEAYPSGSNDHIGGPWTVNSPRLAFKRYVAFKRGQDHTSELIQRSGRYRSNAPANSEKDELGKQRTHRHKQTGPDYHDAWKGSVSDNTTSNGDTSDRDYYYSKKDRTSVKGTKDGGSSGPIALGAREELKAPRPGMTHSGKQFNTTSADHSRIVPGNTSNDVGDARWKRHGPYGLPKVHADAGSGDSDWESIMPMPTLRRAQTMPHQRSTERKNIPTRGKEPDERLLFIEVPPDVASVPRIGKDDVQYHASRRRAGPKRQEPDERLLFIEVPPDVASVPRIGKDNVQYHAPRRRTEPKGEESKGKGKGKEKEKEKEKDEQHKRTAETKAQTKERTKDVRRQNEAKRMAYVESESDDSETEAFTGQKR